MAKINDLYVFVEEENRTFGVSVTEHAVETGVSVTDHVKREATTLSISGEIVGSRADNVVKQLYQMQQLGTLCKYVGRVTLSNCLITEFSTTQTHSIWGGYSFSMTLREIRTAKTSYKQTASTSKTNASAKTQNTKKTGTQQKTVKSKVVNVHHTVKKGDTVWSLVAASKAPYKSLSRPAINGRKYTATEWVMQKNPNAFSKKGDFKTLKIGWTLIVGQR